MPAPQNPPPLPPLVAEQARIQRALDALKACPPVGWKERVLWRGLVWLYHNRLQRTQAAWERAVLRDATPAAHQGYDWEPQVIPIPEGAFLMGSRPDVDKSAHGDERPQHAVHLPAYALGRTPVTNEQYAAFIQASGYEPPNHWSDGKPPAGRASYPVVRVSWYDATAYCDWLAAVTGKPYRLPTEAEWEKAARGTDGRLYPWGNSWDATRCNTKESGRESASPVGLYAQGASPYGLLDMAGNVWEWTSSLHRNYPFQAHDGRQDPNSTDPRVLRGGSWLNFFDSARAASRRSYIPAYHSRLHGFRCCLSGGDTP